MQYPCGHFVFSTLSLLGLILCCLKPTQCVHVILKYSHTIICLAIGNSSIMCAAIVGGMNALGEPDISYFQSAYRAGWCEETGGERDGISKRG